MPRPDSLVVLGWQGMLRATAAGGPTVKRAPFRDAVLERADVTVVGTDDLPSGDAEDVEGLKDVFPRPGQHLVLTAGARGGRLFVVDSSTGEMVHAPAVPVEALDPTGAGDVFAATLFARLHETGDPLAAAHFAAYVAALSVEGAGISRIPQRAELEQGLTLRLDERAATVGRDPAI